jgi:hypothetical protein
MTFDHAATTIHRAELDREIETLRVERAIARDADGNGVLQRARRSAGRVLIAAGEAVSGRENARLGSPGI